MNTKGTSGHLWFGHGQKDEVPLEKWGNEGMTIFFAFDDIVIIFHTLTGEQEQYLPVYLKGIQRHKCMKHKNFKLYFQLIEIIPKIY